MSKGFSKDQTKIIPFDPLSDSRETWNLYHEYRSTLHNQRFPDTPLTTSDETVEKSMKMFLEHPEIYGIYFSILDTVANKQVS